MPRSGQSQVKKPQQTRNYPSYPVNRVQKDFKDAVSIINGYRGFGKPIFEVYRRYWRLDQFKISNEDVAEEVGCSVNTVSRWIQKFKKDLAFQARQPRPKRKNIFTLPNELRTGKHAFDLYLNSLSVTDRKEKVDKINSWLHPETGVLVDKVLTRSLKKSLSLSLSFKGRESLRDSRGTFSRRSERKKKLWNIKRLLHRESRKKTQANLKPDPEKEAPLSAKAFNLAITPNLEKIVSILSLSDQELLKCVAFPTVALEYAINFYLAMNRTEITIYDPKGVFFWKATEYCKANRYTIEWRWYSQCCRSLSLRPFKRSRGV